MSDEQEKLKNIMKSEKCDPLGMYTGVPEGMDRPVQDVDDL